MEEEKCEEKEVGKDCEAGEEEEEEEKYGEDEQSDSEYEDEKVDIDHDEDDIITFILISTFFGLTTQLTSLSPPECTSLYSTLL